MAKANVASRNADSASGVVSKAEEPKLHSEFTEEMAARVRSKLLGPGGATIREMGATLAERFGEISKIRKQREAMGAEYLPKDKQAEYDDLMAKERNPEFRMQVIGRWSAIVETHIKDVYGKEIKDGLGYLMGYGERVSFNRENGHLRLKW